MKLNLRQAIRLGSFCIAMAISTSTQAQNFSAEKSSTILGNLNADNKTGGETTIQISSNKSLVLDVNVSKSVLGNATIIGQVSNEKNASFYLHGNASNLQGSFILKDKKEAYTFTTNTNGDAVISPIDIDKLICTEYQKAPAVAANKNKAQLGSIAGVYDLQSLPGAEAVVLLDFDGQVVTGSYWNGGNTINAAPSGFDNNTILEIWDLMSEDYLPFALNITTSEAVYQAAPANRRMRCIFTPTNTAAPGSGGVAYIGSFSWGNETPCWVFNGGVKGAGEAGSHEIGHTVGLLHDGRNTTPHEEYYAGNGNWAPIMGVGYYVGMVQFSKGEYPFASNSEDDISIITNGNGFTFRNDDYSNFPGTATSLDPDHDGTANITGIIEKQSDQDVFSFQTSGGILNLNAYSPSLQPNLDIALTLTNSTGNIIQNYSPDGSISASLSSINLPAGTYYVYVDGVGKPSVNTNGYSDYASIGTYLLFGSVPPYSPTNQAPTVVITNPINGQHFAFNTPFNISGNANDADGSISKIEVYDNSTLISTVYTSTFSFAFTPATTGAHRLSAIAYDNGSPVLFTVSAPVNITVDQNNSGVCTGGAANGDYTYEAGKLNGVSTIKFIPGTPIAGCNAALIYYKIDNGPIMGSYMEASGSNFIKTYSAPAGSVITFYFTYRIGNTSNERNSSANPHSFTEGNCNGVINNPSACTGGVANGDYTFEASSSNGTTSIKFIPGTPITGCNMALIYYKINNGGIAGYYMDAAGSNFTKSFSAPTGATVTFYFTYRVGTSGAERNSSATPHSFIVGNCGANIQASQSDGVFELNNSFELSLYPNPVKDKLNLQVINNNNNINVEISDLFNRIVLQQKNISADTSIDVNSLENGLYFVRVRNENFDITKRIIVEK